MVERQHAPLKTGLRAALIAMADEYGQNWSSILPWIRLGRRTAHHEELGTTPSTVVFGEDPRLPGELLPTPSSETLQQLIERVKQATTNRPPAQTTLQGEPYVYMPEAAKKATHVFIIRAKKTPLGKLHDGPFKIEERLGDSTLKIKVADYANGAPRFEIRHWNTCFPAPLDQNVIEDKRKPLGRKKLNVEATEFRPRNSVSTSREEIYGENNNRKRCFPARIHAP